MAENTTIVPSKDVSTTHHEHRTAKKSDHDNGTTIHGFIASEEELPKGYFRSPYFIGTYFAIGMNLLASNGGFSYIAPVLTQIKADLGPDTGEDINWLALVYTLGLAVGLTLVGRLTDIYGRRWFFIVGSMLGVIGSVVAATARNIPVLIGGQTMIGLAATTGVSYAFTIGELVPMRYRFIASGLLYLFTYPGPGFAAAISNAFILYTGPGWRWCYYLLIIENGVATLLYITFYHPPTFKMKHGNDSKLAYIRNFDYIGTLFYTAGVLLFILGLNWGGSNYPWKSAHVIATILTGAFCVIALILYEIYVPLKEPLIPMHLFRNRNWVVCVLLLAMGATIYYSQSIVWPSMALTVYSNGDQMWAGWVSCIVGLGVSSGEIIGGIFAKPFGKTRWQCTVCILIGGICLGATATSTPDTRASAIALITIASFAIGWNESVAFSLVTLTLEDQTEIGVAAGIAGSIRSMISTVAATIYVVVLTNRANKTIPDVVVPAVVKAGLPATSIASYFAAVTSGSAEALAKVTGVTPAIIAAGSRALQVAYCDAYRTVFLTSIAFSGIALVLCFFVPNAEDLMTRDVAVTLHGRGIVYGEKEAEAIAMET